MSEVSGCETTESGGDCGKVKNLTPSKGAAISLLLWGNLGPEWQILQSSKKSWTLGIRCKISPVKTYP